MLDASASTSMVCSASVDVGVEELAIIDHVGTFDAILLASSIKKLVKANR